MNFTADDHRYMSEALRLAELGRLTADPNPAVGCVIVNGGEVVGRGWHRAAGQPHAEPLALAEAGHRARGATVYVTLEPCSHQGRTPPCAQALIDAGVSEVVSAMADPHGRVDGSGHEQLSRAGVRVRSGLMERAARALNRGFVARHERGRPWLRIKLAVSLDGFVAGADGQSKWITSAAAREDVQQWRARASAILTGIGTVLADDPQMNLRLPGVDRHLTRVVVDSNGRMPENARMLGLAGTVIVAGRRHPGWERGGVEWCELPSLADGRVDLTVLLERLAERDINEIQVEAGSGLCGALMGAGLVDELLVYQAPVLIGKGKPMLAMAGMEKFADRLHLDLIESRRVGPDWRFLYQPAHQPDRQTGS
ncbi:bifunctional diaminohydroxyphosphoribosylaminopyrimidine deaminase/5-amino-6-(5-phosphoribosylamino)uracil reductase RibD [Wenzhouxiangella sp. AB-CW3]|uniref:bifunctional diaminohydroxyphosphoribosylaminopyrimidine deaminase/5-amino-6-(5-phosphoribosylamino)uracil reductase RibD n=1 Tax=Wenzhouxiangella sp. AB-CW3 TaxID=2771012 RepID=UPI00168AF452|nr:bifunctional diaminohydroxyphosphoribosylaminopyrimidine deaminase/5-amino-6-(5-phosphoribosylamino)uracil reductase RibD [Wenzhouxiangella sp. AB-CW3]QOC23410.1 bifunctional diaminohydroxyphosphoribosylaminopyrimidine deaminase/5-amino-6-(5-phosphoribosylamino)uracil reductase RibD [Wenzhouxiangella sp. AB-CW3]